MTPAELIAKLTLSAKCDCPEFTRDIAREMLGAALEMQRLNLELAKAVDAAKAAGWGIKRCVRCGHERWLTTEQTRDVNDAGGCSAWRGNQPCAGAYAPPWVGRTKPPVEAPSVIVVRCESCNNEWALEGPRSAVDLASMVCSQVPCRWLTPRPRLEVVR